MNAFGSEDRQRPGTALPRRGLEDLEKEEGWARNPEGFVVVKRPDRFETFRVVMER